MKTIAIITSHAPSLVSFRRHLIEKLAAQGHRVLAFAPNFDNASRLSVQQLGALPVDFPLSRTGMNPIHDFRSAWKLLFLLRSLRPDVVLGYFIKPVIYGTLAAWLAGVPRRIAMVEGLGFVFTASGDKLSLARRVLRFGVKCLYRMAFYRANRVVFLNPDDMGELIAANLLPASKAIKLGGIGVDLAQWSPLPPVVQPVTFLLVARLLREKGVGEYAEAARKVKALHPTARFLLLGGLDPNPGAIQLSEVQEWVREGIIEWPGHVPVREWMAQTSVYVLPSYREGVPVSTQEALAMAKPIITSDVPGCRETVIEGDNGYFVAARDPAALAQKMLMFIEHPELIEPMGLASRRIAEARFNVHEVNERLMKVILDN